MWLIRANCFANLLTFQSTHLIRGVTWLSGSVGTGQSISIHTPHTRCDSLILGCFPQLIIFQSTHLIRGVTWYLNLWSSEMGRDFNPHTSYEVWQTCIGLEFQGMPYFNPHTSYEVWPPLVIFMVKGTLFQSTHLIRGVTGVAAAATKAAFAISIHTPHTRCDNLELVNSNNVVKFQSTHLIRGVTSPVGSTGKVLADFNPHTSYEVWLQQTNKVIPAVIFQSTHLIRGVTILNCTFD